MLEAECVRREVEVRNAEKAEVEYQKQLAIEAAAYKRHEEHLEVTRQKELRRQMTVEREAQIQEETRQTNIQKEQAAARKLVEIEVKHQHERQILA